MLPRRWSLLALLSLAPGLPGCAQVTAKPFFDSTDDTSGIRFYEPVPLLVATKENVKIVFVPNPSRGIAIGFRTWLARHSVDLKVEEGSLTGLSSDADSAALASGLLTLVESLGKEAIENAAELKALMAPAAAALGEEIPGSIEGIQGVYRFKFSPTGEFLGLEKVL